MKLLSVGAFSGLSNTCLHRHWALKKLIDQVDEVDTSIPKVTLWYRITYHLFLYGLPISIPESQNENKRIKELIDKNKYDIVWIDKGVTIRPDTLKYIKMKQPRCFIISYSPDNMALRHNQSQNFFKCIPLYDCHITCKSYILDDMKRLGARNIYFVNESYSPEFHYPRKLSQNDDERLGGDVGFVGVWEKERCDSILYLADHGIKVRVWGGGKWRRYKNYSVNLKIEDFGLYSEDYPKSFQAFKISLCFLRKMNFDQQTSRSVEIPACGGFMLAERTQEHLAMFEEGKEAAFFSSNEELLAKCQYYLKNETERKLISRFGKARCQTSNYSNEKMINYVLQLIYKKY